MIVALLLTFGACATTKTNSYPQLTRANIQKECKPVNFWNLSVLNYPVVLVRFNNCLKVKDLLMLTSLNNGFTKEIRRTSRKLLKNHYLNYLNDTDSEKSWATKKLKEEREENLTTLFYLLESQTKDK
jgi:hypothetical protein